MSQQEKYKIILLGEIGVGKSRIISQFLEGKFDPNLAGVDFYRKTIDLTNNKKLTLDIWDTLGREKYHSIPPSFYYNVNAIIFVYDITNKKSFEAIKEYWLEEAKQKCDYIGIKAIVANKNDLYEERQIYDEEGEKLAINIGAIFAKISAKDNEGIISLFQNIGQELLDSNENQIETKKSFKLSNKKKKVEVKCCQNVD